MIIKVWGGLEPLGPIGVYAYARTTSYLTSTGLYTEVNAQCENCRRSNVNRRKYCQQFDRPGSPVYDIERALRSNYLGNTSEP